MNGRRAEIGLLLDGAVLIAAWRASEHSEWSAEELPCDATPSSIRAALETLADRLPADAQVTAVLARPLANTLAVKFPRMRTSLLESVLSRDWTRYVIGSRITAHSVTVRPLTAGRWSASFAPTDSIEALSLAAHDHQWSSLRIASLDDVFATMAKSSGLTDAIVFKRGTGGAFMVHARNGIALLGRRFNSEPSIDDVEAFVHAAVGAGEVARKVPIASVGGHSLMLIERGLTGRTIEVKDHAPSFCSVIPVAAASLSSLPTWRSTFAQQAVVRSARSLTLWLLAGAAAALVLALVVERWSVRSVLASVTNQRRSIAAGVNGAMSQRYVLQSQMEMATTLAMREREASRTSTLFASLVNALPPGTTLATLGVTADSVTIEGESRRSADVYDALRAVPGIERVTLSAPLRQERQSTDAPVSHFAFNARLRSNRGAR